MVNAKENDRIIATENGSENLKGKDTFLHKRKKKKKKRERTHETVKQLKPRKVLG